jgi:uncharacterized protein VirK/YbjX
MTVETPSLLMGFLGARGPSTYMIANKVYSAILDNYTKICYTVLIKFFDRNLDCSSEIDVVSYGFRKLHQFYYSS